MIIYQITFTYIVHRRCSDCGVFVTVAARQQITCHRNEPTERRRRDTGINTKSMINWPVEASSRQGQNDTSLESEQHCIYNDLSWLVRVLKLLFVSHGSGSRCRSFYIPLDKCTDCVRASTQRNLSMRNRLESPEISRISEFFLFRSMQFTLMHFAASRANSFLKNSIYTTEKYYTYIRAK